MLFPDYVTELEEKVAELERQASVLTEGLEEAIGVGLEVTRRWSRTVPPETSDADIALLDYLEGKEIILTEIESVLQKLKEEA